MSVAPKSRTGRILSGRNSFSLNLDTDGLESFFDELGNDIEAAVRPAAQAGAQVLYDQVKRNVQSLGSVTGNLDRSIYQTYSEANSGPLKAEYHVSWNHKKAPHGHLVEYGHIQRYASYVGKDGKWHTAVRPEKQGTPKPRRRASQAEKDAYYVLRPGGPIQVPAKAFVRRAESKFDAAYKAMEAELLRRINGGDK